MTEKKTVLLQLGSSKDSKVVGQIDFVGDAVRITLDQDHDGAGLIDALSKGRVEFGGRVPTILDYYSDKDSWLPGVREQLS